MFALAWGKRRTGQSLGNRPLIANASMTFIDGCLASGILVALVVDRLFGWWWADPLAAYGVAAIATIAGRRAWLGVNCCAIPPSTGLLLQRGDCACGGGRCCGTHSDLNHGGISN